MIQIGAAGLKMGAEENYAIIPFSEIRRVTYKNGEIMAFDSNEKYRFLADEGKAFIDAYSGYLGFTKAAPDAVGVKVAKPKAEPKVETKAEAKPKPTTTRKRTVTKKEA